MDLFAKTISKMLPCGGAGNNGYRSRCNCCGIPRDWRNGGKYRQLARRRARRIMRNRDRAELMREIEKYAADELLDLIDEAEAEDFERTLFDREMNDDCFGDWPDDYTAAFPDDDVDCYGYDDYDYDI